MRVDLEESLFQASGRPYLDLLGLIALADRVGHTLVAPAGLVSIWVAGLPELLREAVETLLQTHRERVADLSDGAPHVSVADGASDWSKPQINLDDAWSLLPTPLELLVENERNDWAFLRSIATAAARRQLDQAIARGALAVRQGGGITEITNSVKALTDPSGDQLLAERRRVRRLRTWVMFDRDAPSGVGPVADKTQPGPAALKCEAACRVTVAGDPWPLRWHRLHRRHIESYLPDAVLLDWATARNAADQARGAAISAVRAADPTAAWSLHMKGGLLKEFPKKLADGTPAPTYHAVTFQNLHLSGDSLARRRAESAVPQSEWPPPFDTLAPTTRADLLSGFPDIAGLFSASLSTHDGTFEAEFNRGTDGPAARLIESILERL